MTRMRSFLTPKAPIVWIAALGCAVAMPCTIWGQNGWTNTGSVVYTGNSVGIGTSTPGYPLEVYGSIVSNNGAVIALNGVLVANSTAPYTYYIDPIDNVDATVGVATPAGGLLGGTTTGDLTIRAGGSNRVVFGASNAGVEMILNAYGQVGIGTQSPNRTLHVNGNNASIGIQDSNTGGHEYSLGNFNTGDGSLGLYDYTAGAVRWLVDSSGNVGIGTTTPAHLLHVAGKIGAEEVIVSSTGADYVFDPGYVLKPLDDVAAYIAANHHLPDVPSAAEMKQSGVGVAEMQSKLLAKIEELTLHLIEEKQRNDQLERRNDQMQEQNRLVQQRIARLEAAGN